VVVVGAKGVQHRPNDIVDIRAVQGFRCRHVGRHDDGDDHIAVLLAGGLAHHAPDGLHDVHGAVAGREEEDRVQRRHVHALGKATDIGEDAADIGFGRDRVEPRELLLPKARAHRAVHVVGLDGDARGTFLGRKGLEILLVEGVEALHDLPRGVDVRAKGDGLVHGGGVLRDDGTRIAHADLRERVRAADELGRVVHLDLAVRGRDGAAQLLRDFGHGEDEYLVVGKKTLRDRLAEADAVELRAVGLRIVHRAEDGILGLRVLLRLVVVDARRRRHVEALPGDEA